MGGDGGAQGVHHRVEHRLGVGATQILAWSTAGDTGCRERAASPPSG
jgi:hypothetical protein